MLKSGFLLQIFGLILLVFVGIIFAFIRIKEGLLSNGFLIIYFLYLVYVAIIIFSYSKESRMFNKDFDESVDLLKLRMNNSITLSLPFIILAITIFISFAFETHPGIWLMGLSFLIYGGIYFYSSYYLRYKELDKIFRIKEMGRIADLKNKKTKN